MKDEISPLSGTERKTMLQLLLWLEHHTLSIKGFFRDYPGVTPDELVQAITALQSLLLTLPHMQEEDPSGFRRHTS